MKQKSPASKWLTADNSLGFQLWQASNTWQRLMRQALQSHDLTHVQYLMLATLIKLEEVDKKVGITQSVLCQTANADKMMTSKVVRTLEARGLVARVDMAGDARAYRISSTPVGRGLATLAAASVHEVENAVLAQLGKKAEKLAKYLEWVQEASLQESE